MIIPGGNKVSNRAVYIPKIFHIHAKKQGNLSVYVFEAMQQYVAELSTYSIIDRKEYKVVGLYWNERSEYFLRKAISMSPCITASEVIRHAIDRQIARERKISDSIDELKPGKTIAEKKTYNIIGVA